MSDQAMCIAEMAQLDADNRQTVCELIMCHPYAGELARLYLDTFPVYRGAPDAALLELTAWLVIAREACGVATVGHA